MAVLLAVLFESNDLKSSSDAVFEAYSIPFTAPNFAPRLTHKNRSSAAPENFMENTSGQGPLAQVPAEIDRWNWGAFLLNWIWGIGNDSFIALLSRIGLGPKTSN